MSSIGKSGKTGQRIHKERAQPSHREHLGPLEKKKDYKLRAVDFQKKRDRLTVLHREALDRNPDEFYFHMINSHTRHGVHKENAPKSTEDTVLQRKLMDTKDVRYVRYKLDMERKKIEKLKGELHMLDCAGMPQNKHTIFVDSDKEARNFNPTKYFNTHQKLLDRRFNRPTMESLKTEAFGTDVQAQIVSANRQRNNAYKRLEKRLDRAKELAVVVGKMEAAKNLATATNKNKNNNNNNKTERRKPVRVRKGAPNRAPIYWWNVERKR